MRRCRRRDGGRPPKARPEAVAARIVALVRQPVGAEDERARIHDLSQRGGLACVESPRVDVCREEVADAVDEVGDVVRVEQTAGRRHRAEGSVVGALEGVGRIGREEARFSGDEVVGRVEVKLLLAACLAPVVSLPLVALALRGVPEPLVVRLVGGEQGGAGDRVESGRLRLEEFAPGIEAGDFIFGVRAGERRIVVVGDADISVPREVEHLGRGEVEILRIGSRLAGEPDVVRIGDVVAAVPVADVFAVPVIVRPKPGRRRERDAGAAVTVCHGLAVPRDAPGDGQLQLLDRHVPLGGARRVGAFNRHDGTLGREELCRAARQGVKGESSGYQ